MEYYCPLCKQPMIIGGQEMESATQDEPMEGDDHIITYASCSHCHCDVMIREA